MRVEKQGPMAAPPSLLQLDLPLSEAFYKWLLGQENTFTAQDLQVSASLSAASPRACRLTL